MLSACVEAADPRNCAKHSYPGNAWWWARCLAHVEMQDVPRPFAGGHSASRFAWSLKDTTARQGVQMCCQRQTIGLTPPLDCQNSISNRLGQAKCFGSRLLPQSAHISKRGTKRHAASSCSDRLLWAAVVAGASSPRRRRTLPGTRGGCWQRAGKRTCVTLEVYRISTAGTYPTTFWLLGRLFSDTVN